MASCSKVIDFLVVEKEKSDNKYAGLAYQRVIQKFKTDFKPEEKITISKLGSMDLTDNMKLKISSFLSNPRSGSKSKKESILEKLTQVMGIGDKLAESLVKSGVKNISDLNKHYDKLPVSTQMFLTHKPEMKTLHSDYVKILKAFPVGKNVIPVGSFRRNKPESKDLDLLVITNSDAKFEKIIEEIKNSVAEFIVYAKGPEKISAIFRPKTPKILSEKKYKIDIFRSKENEAGTYLAYATGSKEFNIMMRQKAKKMGYQLNQNCLVRISDSKIFNFKTEKSLFEFLKMDYAEPETRT